MCLYCNVGDSWFRYDPPWKRQELPQLPQSVPMPVYPMTPAYAPWPIEKLREYLKLLTDIKAMEDKLGCPCEPNKADYLKLLADRIKVLEEKERAAGREGA